MGNGPRERLIVGAIELVRERGVHGTGLAALLERSNVSRNSLYQHFPAGKGELVAEAVAQAGRRQAAIIGKITAAGMPVEWLAAMIDWWRRNLERTEFTAGCPIVGAALAASEPRVQAAAAQAFADWTTALSDGLATHGMPPERARSVAGVVVSALEGAIVQSRALKSTAPLDDLAAMVPSLLHIPSKSAAQRGLEPCADLSSRPGTGQID